MALTSPAMAMESRARRSSRRSRQEKNSHVAATVMERSSGSSWCPLQPGDAQPQAAQSGAGGRLVSADRAQQVHQHHRSGDGAVHHVEPGNGAQKAAEAEGASSQDGGAGAELQVAAER